MKTILTILLLSLISVRAFAGGFPDITIPELKSAIASGTVTIIDANGSESWQKGHIPGAFNFDACKDKLSTILPKDKGALIVAYCGGPQCHAYEAAAMAAEKLGYTNIKHLSAGITGWIKAGEPTEKGHITVVDDQNTKTAGNPARLQPAKNTAMKDSIPDAASQIALSKPAANLMFYGDVGVGCVATIGHNHCNNWSGYPSGMYSGYQLGTDVRLNDAVSVGVQVQTVQFNQFH